MNIISLGIYFGIGQYLIGLLTFIYNEGQNIIMLIISQELLLLAVGILFVHFSFILDDMTGTTITLFQLPLAGAESAIAQSIIIAYFPYRGTLTI